MNQHDQQAGFVSQAYKLAEYLLLLEQVVVQVNSGSARAHQVPVQVYPHLVFLQRCLVTDVFSRVAGAEASLEQGFNSIKFLLVSDQDVDVTYRAVGWIGVDGMAQVRTFKHQVFNVSLFKGIPRIPQYFSLHQLDRSGTQSIVFQILDSLLPISRQCFLLKQKW